MTNNFFFSNTKLIIVYIGFGYLFMFAGTYWLHQTEQSIFAVGVAVFFLILALVLVTKQYGKENEIIKNKKL